jgi:hypothetical protein
MRINEILNEGWSDFPKRITLPVSVQMYNEETDQLLNYSVPVTFATSDVGLALSYLLMNGTTGPGMSGIGAINDADMAADALMQYAGTYANKAKALRRRLAPKGLK